jgi:hypothetical protein
VWPDLQPDPCLFPKSPDAPAWTGSCPSVSTSCCCWYCCC